MEKVRFKVHHVWLNNVCTVCGIIRARMTVKQGLYHSAIWGYYINEKLIGIRPDCHSKEYQTKDRPSFNPDTKHY